MIALERLQAKNQMIECGNEIAAEMNLLIARMHAHVRKSLHRLDVLNELP